jgi:hypothetical protein
MSRAPSLWRPNARISLYDGGQYLLARLDPATPPELADAVKKFANL